MKSWDTIVVGAGVIGLSLAWRLRQRGASVLIIERSEPAREATYAAGGMIAYCDPQTPAPLQPLANASAAMYRDFTRELQVESGISPDLREQGCIAMFEGEQRPACPGARLLAASEQQELEPLLAPLENAYLLPEGSVDPRSLGQALAQAAKKSGVDFVTGSPVTDILVSEGRVAGARTERSQYSAGAVVNCAGAWASQLKPCGVPTRPVKGQMVCLVPATGTAHTGPVVQRVIRTGDVYIIPRSDGRILLGATVEEAGFDKHVDADTIQRLHRAGARAVPALGQMRIHDAWAGLRPGTPDKLPILGETSLPRYFAATGHYRDGILLAPITAELMAEVLAGRQPMFDIAAFSPQRFG